MPDLNTLTREELENMFVKEKTMRPVVIEKVKRMNPATAVLFALGVVQRGGAEAARALQLHMEGKAHLQYFSNIQ